MTSTKKTVSRKRLTIDVVNSETGEIVTTMKLEPSTVVLLKALAKHWNLNESEVVQHILRVTANLTSTDGLQGAVK